MRCGTCGFGFVSPWVSGDGEFYRLVHQSDPHYPDDRWEFEQTLNALKHDSRHVRAVLEVGAGKGAFVEKLRAIAPACRIVAADLDEGAVAQMRAKDIDAMVGSLADAAGHGPFDAICMFQTVEHLADLDGLYATLSAAVTGTGSIFISVPNGESIAVQERLTGYLDMPPNHVGRWTPRAFDAAAGRFGLRVVDQRTEPVSTLGVAWHLARYRLMGRAYTASSFAHRANAIRFRPIRGVTKLALAAGYVPQMLKHRDHFLPLVRWVHLKRV
jgi:2-polyprenyl-3-methyl-5-hydroxy-6-metoxy-1,4-benzoquinol methylase